MESLLRIVIFCILSSSFLSPPSVSAYRLKLLKIFVYGAGEESVSFSGWCAIEIGNNTLHRIYIEGEDRNLAPTEVHGSYIDSCEISNESGQGSITLILHKNNKELYSRTSKEDESVITYGPTMKRYSTKPLPFNQSPKQHNQGNQDE